MRAALAILVFLSAIPDTMAAPVVKELLIDRYHTSVAAAQFFNAVNLLGALAAIPLLVALRRRGTVEGMVVGAAAADAVLLAAMILPLGMGWTLALRSLEGVTDVLVFAGLFDLVRRGGRGHVATNLGVASIPLLLGLGAGAMIGGAVVRHTAEESAALWIFGISALLSLVVAGAARGLSLSAPRAVVDARPMIPAEIEEVGKGSPVWPALAMTFSDRAAGGILTGTLPIALAQVLGYSPTARGILIGLPLTVMALGVGPAGWLCDRFGSLRVRIVAGFLYASSLAMIAIAPDRPWMLAAVMFTLGVSGSALFASSLALVVQRGDSTVRLGAFRGAGDLGFLCGGGLSLLLLSALGGDLPALGDYQLLILAFAGFHGLTTVIAGGALALWSRATNAAPS